MTHRALHNGVSCDQTESCPKHTPHKTHASNDRLENELLPRFLTLQAIGLLAVRGGVLLVNLRRRDRGSSVLPRVTGATSSNHLRCGGLRRCVMKASPICSERVAKPAFGVPVGDSTREGFPSEFDRALRASLLAGNSHTQARSQYCRTGFPVGSSRLPSSRHARPELWATTMKIAAPVSDRYYSSVLTSGLIFAEQTSALGHSLLPPVTRRGLLPTIPPLPQPLAVWKNNILGRTCNAVS
jgi:hypothetical protein